MEQEIQPEYERVLQTLVQQIKEELDQLYNSKIFKRVKNT